MRLSKLISSIPCWPRLNSPSLPGVPEPQVLLHPPTPKSGLLSLLTHWWREQHTVFLQPGDEADRDASAGFKQQLCCTLSLCICSGTGQLAFWMHDNVKKLLRPLLRTKQKVKPPGRILVDEAKLVLKLTAAATASAAEATVDPFAVEQYAEQPVDLYFHLAYINLSTYHSTLLQLRPVEPLGSTLSVLPHPEFEMDTAAWAKHINFQWRWRLEFLVIQGSRHLVGISCMGSSSRQKIIFPSCTV